MNKFVLFAVSVLLRSPPVLGGRHFTESEIPQQVLTDFFSHFALKFLNGTVLIHHLNTHGFLSQ